MSTKRTSVELQQIISAMAIGGRFPLPGPMRWLVQADGQTVLQQAWFPPPPMAGPVTWLDVPTDVEEGGG
jgi:hypothetical protein